VNVFWKISKDRRKRERELEYKPGKNAKPSVHQMSIEQKEALINEALTIKTSQGI
jgi:hypothetical protein